MAGGSMAYYLLKLFSSRPARWLDRVVIGAFVAAPAMAHVEIAKRRWVGWGAWLPRVCSAGELGGGEVVGKAGMGGCSCIV